MRCHLGDLRFGLSTSLNRVQADLSHAASDQVRVLLGGHQGLAILNGQSPAGLSLAAQEHAVQSALHAQPGTRNYAAEADDQEARSGYPASCRWPASAATRAGPATP